MSFSQPHDAIYATPKRHVDPFEFDEDVANVFSDMIDRSVPGYSLMLPLIGLIAARYTRPFTHVYDLGCSLGATTLAMRHQIQRPGCRIIGVDNSPAMLARCRELIDEDASELPVELVQADIQAVPIKQASVVVLNLTLQFIPQPDRDTMIQHIFNGLLPGGALILSEKVVFEDDEQNGRFIDIHHDYKRARGYSEMEISQKRTALENVLIPETIAQHQQRLKNAGFSSAEVWFQAFNFMSILAIKKDEL